MNNHRHRDLLPATKFAPLNFTFTVHVLPINPVVMTEKLHKNYSEQDIMRLWNQLPRSVV